LLANWRGAPVVGVMVRMTWKSVEKGAGANEFGKRTQEFF
jgi:hypothetical protein